MRFISLFAGIGGFDLGLERAGMTCVAQVEIEPFCQQVLKKHWPNVPLFSDVREFNRSSLDGDIDLICGGFPCQDISIAGRGVGIEGERSGLWKEMSRIIGEFGPRWVIVENVPAIRTRGADSVLDDLEGQRYTGWPLVVGAWSVGAPHRRERAWILAHRNQVGRDATRKHPHGERSVRPSWPPPQTLKEWRDMECWLSETSSAFHRNTSTSGNSGTDDGISRRLDRIAACGNSIVPQVAEVIGRAVLTVDKPM
jgi:DNA (cytosine-5)-methyltransferase 1